MVTVYLWDAGTWSGVSGSLEDAQRYATVRLGADGQGRIESARLVTAVWSLSLCYERTGRIWTAGRHRDGTVVWVSDSALRKRLPVAS
jgi:hypothetical protein